MYVKHRALRCTSLYVWLPAYQANKFPKQSVYRLNIPIRDIIILRYRNQHYQLLFSINMRNHYQPNHYHHHYYRRCYYFA